MLEEWVGKLCTINASNDLRIDPEEAFFIGRVCRVVKITKAGLIQIELVSDTRKKMSFAKYNVDLIGD